MFWDIAQLDEHEISEIYFTNSLLQHIETMCDSTNLTYLIESIQYVFWAHSFYE